MEEDKLKEEWRVVGYFQTYTEIIEAKKHIKKYSPNAEFLVDRRLRVKEKAP